MKKFDSKYVILFLIICFAAWFLSEHPDPLRNTVLAFFALPKLVIWSWLFATITLIVHKLKTGQLQIRTIMSFDDFKTGYEELFSFRSNPITFGCSVAFAKAFILQFFGAGKYFVNFSETEIEFLGILTAYSLFVSTFEVVKRLIEIFTQPKAEAAIASTSSITPMHETVDVTGTAKEKLWEEEKQGVSSTPTK